MRFISEVIQLQYVHLFNMKLYQKLIALYSMYTQLPNNKLVANKQFEIQLSNYQGHGVHITISQ